MDQACLTPQDMRTQAVMRPGNDCSLISLMGTNMLESPTNTRFEKRKNKKGTVVQYNVGKCQGGRALSHIVRKEARARKKGVLCSVWRSSVGSIVKRRTSSCFYLPLVISDRRSSVGPKAYVAVVSHKTISTVLIPCLTLDTFPQNSNFT